jgi:hypothetical protein
MGTPLERADALDEFGGGQETIRFEHLALAKQPRGFIAPILNAHPFVEHRQIDCISQAGCHQHTVIVLVA